MRRLNRDDDGITIVLVTSAWPLLLLMAALALDIGSLFFNKARLRTAPTLVRSRLRSTAPTARPSTRRRSQR